MVGNARGDCQNGLKLSGARAGSGKFVGFHRAARGKQGKNGIVHEMALVAGASAPALAQIGCRLNDKGRPMPP